MRRALVALEFLGAVFPHERYDGTDRPARAKYWCGLDMSPEEAGLLGGYPVLQNEKNNTTRLQ